LLGTKPNIADPKSPNPSVDKEAATRDGLDCFYDFGSASCHLGDMPDRSGKRPKRERFDTPVTCPQCALNGTANWQESERGDLETTIKSVSDGFRIDRGTEIYCADCGVKAIVGRTVSRAEMKPRATQPRRQKNPDDGSPP
jgi:hypothetical protein